MVNPDLLVDSIRDKLRLIPAVVTMAANAANITSYQDNDDTLSSAVNEMTTPSILVAWIGSEPAEEGNAKWVHQVSIYLRLGAQRLGAAFTAICNSVATGDQQKFTETKFHPDFEQIGIPVFVREQDDDGAEFPKIDMRFRQTSQA